MSERIPFHKPALDDEDVEAVTRELRDGWLTMGPTTHSFETAFCKRIGSAHAVAVSSGTAALHLALCAIGLQAGDEVIVPDMTFTATGEVVTYFGAKPVIVDVDPSTLTIDPQAVERAIGKRTKAIIPVHYAGQPCRMDALLGLASDYDLLIVEDAAHSLPATYQGKMVGTIGDLTAFSFYATKTLTTGEGGMITSENAEWADRLRTLRLHGISKDAWKRYAETGSWYYEVSEPGFKYNLTDPQAALGLSQLKKLDAANERRAALAHLYTEAFSGSDLVQPPTILEDRTTSWHLYVLRLNLEKLTIDRARFIDELDLRGIGTSVHFIPLHRHPFYAKSLQYVPGDFPVAEREYQRIISLPIYPALSSGDAERVADTVLTVARAFRR